MAEEVVLMKGNEAIAHAAAIRIGVDGYFGYPITPNRNIGNAAKRNLGKLPVWWCCRQKVKSSNQHGIWRCSER